MRNRTRRGNVLIIILLGIVLFAALSWAVSQNFRGGNERLSATRTESLADDILMTAAGYEKAVNRMISKGVSESRLSFSRISGDGYELSPAATPEESVFNIAGGGVNYLDPPQGALDATRSSENYYGSWIFSGTMSVQGVGTEGAGGSTKELLAILPYVRKEVCVSLNKRLGITNPSNAPPKEQSNITLGGLYAGTFSSGSVGIDVVGGHVSGFKAGCFESKNINAVLLENRYFFYYALLIR